MIIDPREISKNKSVVLTPFSKIQQSGIDISFNRIAKLYSAEKKQDVKINTKTNSFYLTKGVYEFICNECVAVPCNAVALIIVRSSYNRQGTYITTGLYDNGFKGYIGGIMHVSFSITIKKNERVAQVVFWRSEANACYNGQYQDKESYEKT